MSWVLAILSTVHAAPRTPVSDGFDFPVGEGQAINYYDAGPFGQNGHLGADWNLCSGGNTDLGAPVSVSYTHLTLPTILLV